MTWPVLRERTFTGFGKLRILFGKHNTNDKNVNVAVKPLLPIV